MIELQNYHFANVKFRDEVMY